MPGRLPRFWRNAESFWTDSLPRKERLSRQCWNLLMTVLSICSLLSAGVRTAAARYVWEHGGEVRVGTRAFNCSNYSNQEAPCSFTIWRNIGGHQLTLEEAKELCEKNITSSELEMYREDGSIYRKRLGLAPDKLQIVKI